MIMIELSQHPELTTLVAAVRQGEAVEIVEHGRPVVRCVSPPATLRDRLLALQRHFISPPYAGSEVIDQRRESERQI